jgi:LPXTG-site transpeptidase (sortase) family protein
MAPIGGRLAVIIAEDNAGMRGARRPAVYLAAILLMEAARHEPSKRCRIGSADGRIARESPLTARESHRGDGTASAGYYRQRYSGLGLFRILFAIPIGLVVEVNSRSTPEPGDDKIEKTSVTARRGPRVRLLANILLALGAILLLGGAGSYGYSYYLEQQARSDPWLQQLEEKWQATSPASAAAPDDATTASSLALEPTVPAEAAASPPVQVTPTPRVYPEAVGMRIPSIGVDSRVISVGVVDGEYEVPRFAVGHYSDTARPGLVGNGVYSGHLESIASGNVFARLPEIELGAEVQVFTEEGIWRYEVKGIKTVKNDDLSVMAPADNEVITLITCTGRFDPAARQYTHRLIVTAEPVGESGPVRPAPAAD